MTTHLDDPGGLPETDAPVTVGLGGMGKRAVRNTVLVLTARVVSRVIAMVMVILVARQVGDSGFGIMQTVITYAALVNVAVDLGYGTLYVRQGARHPDELSRYMGTLLSLKVVASVVSLGFLAALLAIPGFNTYLLPGFLLMVTSGYSNLLRSSLYALQRLAYEAVAIVLESALLLGLSIWGIHTNQGIAFFIWAYVISYACTIVYFSVALSAHRMVRLRFAFDYQLLRQWFTTALAVGFTSVVTTVYFFVDVPILQQICAPSIGTCDAQVGWYTLAYKPFEALLFLPFTLRNIVFPVFSVYFSARSGRLALATEKLYRALLVLGWPIGIGLFILVSPINNELRLFPESANALRILALGVVFVFVDNTFISTLVAMNRQNLFAKIAFAGLLFNLILNVVLIPHYGYFGASWATSVTEAFLALVGWWCLRREGITLHVWRLSWRILVAGALMGAALVPFSNVQGAVVIWLIVGAALLYGVLLLLLRTPDAEDWGLIRRAMGRAPSPVE